MGLVLSAILFSLASNLDNVVIGIAYGIKKIKINMIANVIIAVVTSVGTFLSMSVGKYISEFLPHFAANMLGAGAITILGIYFVIQSIRKLVNDKNSRQIALKNTSEMIEYAEKSDLDRSGDISIKEALLAAFGLTFNNIGTGVAASITGVNITVTVAATFILSILTIKFGENVGNHVLGEFFGKYSPLFSGVLLILLGIIEFLN